jgi:hypothetical protein
MTLGELSRRLRVIGASISIDASGGVARVEVRVGSLYYGASGPLGELDDVVATALLRVEEQALECVPSDQVWEEQVVEQDVVSEQASDRPSDRP